LLGQKIDKDPEWRPTAIYTREELELLISDERVPLDRRVMYALEGVGALRHGEAAGLRIRHYDPTCKPLGKLTIATSYDKGRTKTKVPRYMPVHPTLAILLDHWLAVGWPSMMGRKPTPDDVLVPTPKGLRIPLGRMRDKNYSYKEVHDRP
jgi:integrase